MISKMLLYSLLASLLGCSSASKSVTKMGDLRVQEVDSTPLGSSSDQIRSKFGAPHEKDELKEGDKKYIWWSYYTDTESRIDRTVFEFDSSSNKLVSKWWFPRKDEAEYDIRHWSQKLSEKKETLIPCGRHWSEISYLNPAENFVVQSREQKTEVIAIGWLDNDRIAEYRDKFKKPCPKKK
jgi:hypothetical protein